MGFAHTAFTPLSKLVAMPRDPAIAGARDPFQDRDTIQPGHVFSNRSGGARSGTPRQHPRRLNRRG